MAVDVSCLYTTLRNISGGTLRFGFIPPHGKELADNEEVLVLGDFYDRLAMADHRERSRASFEAALENNLITVIRTPEPVFYDMLLDVTRMAKLSNNTVVLDDPCWESVAA